MLLQWDRQRETHWPLLSRYVRSQNVLVQLRSILANKTSQISFSNSKPKGGYFHCVDVQISANLVCAIIDVIFVVSNNQPVSTYNSNTISCGQFRNWDWPFDDISFSKKIYITEAAMYDKISFYALDLGNISSLVKTKTKARAQCLMVNTGSLTYSKSPLGKSSPWAQGLV